MVVRAELDYRKSLTSGDRFFVSSRIQQVSKLRFEFLQDIYRLPDETLMMNARITGTAMNERGRPFMPDALFASYWPKPLNARDLHRPRGPVLPHPADNCG